MAIKILRDFSKRLLNIIFKRRREISLGFYGPTNAGKCITPETEVVLYNGQIRRIGDIFEETRKKNNIFGDYKETYIDVSDQNLIVPSFDKNTLKIIPKKVSYVYSQKYKGDIISIKTKSGREIKATPNHPLIRISDLGVEFVRCGDLKIGESIGITKKIALCSSIEIPLVTDLNFNINGQIIQSKAKFHNTKTITTPSYIDENLVSFIAYVLSESYHGKNKIIFSNTSPLLLNHFKFLTKKVFDLSFIERENKGVMQIEIYSKTLNDWLYNCLNMKPGNSGEKYIPNSLMGLSDNLTSIILRRLFDCEGYVPKTAKMRGAEIEFSSKSKKMVEQVQILLNRFGIVGRFNKRTIKGEFYYSLLIGGSDNHRLFKDKIGFDLKEKSERLSNLCNVGLKRNRFYLPIVNLLENIRKDSGLSQEEFFLDNKHVSRMKTENRITYHRIAKMAEVLKNKFVNKLANSDALWDEIIEIKKEDYNDYVYDLTIEDTHTFILSNGLIAHNTSLANRICKDWTGEEIGKVSNIPHETRHVQFKEEVEIKYKEKILKFKLVDTPGIATKIDYEDFMKFKLRKKEAQKRAKEATQGIIESIKWLDDVNAVIIVLDSTENPYSQVNITIIGNLISREIPVLIVANKMDLGKADIKKIAAAFPEYEVVGISAKTGKGIDEFYESVFRLAKKV